MIGVCVYVRVCVGGVSEQNFLLSASLPPSVPPSGMLSVKQTCSDSVGLLLFRLGRRQSSPSLRLGRDR